MVKRLFDVVAASFVLAAAAPVLLIAAIGIKITSPGPILYRAARVGRNRRQLNAGRRYDLPERRHTAYGGRIFTMYKLRTMRFESRTRASVITAGDDPRVFPVGALLRRTKIDELPQLVNVLKGDMALVGPRPEAPQIVRDHYRTDDLMTLQVSPGLTSPGTLYYYTHGESLLTADQAEDVYVRVLLPLKLALDREYVTNNSFLRDLTLLVRTLAVILTRALGNGRFGKPSKLAAVDLTETN